MNDRGVLHYLAIFARCYFGIHCLMSGANYYLHFSVTGTMTDPIAAKFMDAITTIGIYQAVKTLELIVGVFVLSGFMLPLALVLEFPISLMILSLALFKGPDIHLLTALKEVLLNAFLFAAYAGYYLRILTPKARQAPLWDARVRVEAAAFYKGIHG